MEIVMNTFIYYGNCELNRPVSRYERARAVLAYACGRLGLGLIGDNVGE